MKNKLNNLIESVFSILIIISIAGGGIVFAMFIIALVLGGPTGNSLALNAKDVVMPMFIRAAALAILTGLINYYVLGEHALTVDENK